jgi:hypothetical protein
MGKFSTRLIRKGALISETREVLSTWDFDQSVKDNLHQVVANHVLHARSEAWLREIVVTLSSRFAEIPAHELRSLGWVARAPIDLDVWRACLLWHIGRVDTLYYEFAVDWLFQQFQSGLYLIRTEDCVPFVKACVKRHARDKRELSEYGNVRAARDLLRMASDVGLLTPGVPKRFTHYHIPEEAFLYILYAMHDNAGNVGKIVNSLDWRMYIMEPGDVEREILRLHQFHKLHYEVAGSLAQLMLPYDSLADYTRELAA